MIMANIPVQYRQRLAQIAFAKRQVINRLEWDELQYGEFQFKIGCSYLQNYIPNDPDGIDMLIKERMFWNWWKNRWAERDEQVLLMQFSPTGNIVTDYKWMHNPVELAGLIRPNAICLGDCYAILIGDIFHSKNR